MADQNVPAGTTGPTALTEVLRGQTNELYDAIALLDALAERVDDLGLPQHASDEAKERAHTNLRLTQQARAKVQAAIDAFDKHI